MGRGPGRPLSAACAPAGRSPPPHRPPSRPPSTRHTRTCTCRPPHSRWARHRGQRWVEWVGGWRRPPAFADCSRFSFGCRGPQPFFFIFMDGFLSSLSLSLPVRVCVCFTGPHTFFLGQGRVRWSEPLSSCDHARRSARSEKLIFHGSSLSRPRSMNLLSRCSTRSCLSAPLPPRRLEEVRPTPTPEPPPPSARLPSARLPSPASFSV